MDGITIYSPYREFPEKIFESLPPNISLKINRIAPDVLTQYVMSGMGLTITLNLMKPEEVPKHLEGLAGFVTHIYRGNPNARGQQIIDQVRRFRTVVGVLFEPDNSEPTIPLKVSMLIAERAKGMIFVRGTFLDSEDRIILAPDGKFDRKAVINAMAPPKPWWKVW